MPLDLVLRQGRLTGSDEALARHRRRGRPHRRHRAPYRRRRAASKQLDGRLVIAGFVETHIHLDKSCILDRCNCERGTLKEAIETVAAAKRAFTEADIHARAQRTLEKAIIQGTTRMRTHVEVDPRVGLNGFHAVRALKRDYAWALDLRDLRVPAGRPDQRSRHRGAAGARPASRAPTSSAAAPIPTPIRRRRPRASSTSRAASISTSTFIWISTSIPPGCISTRCAARPMPIAGAAGSRSAMSPSSPPSIVPACAEIGAAPGRCRRRRHGAAGDRPVPDGAGA